MTTITEHNLIKILKTFSISEMNKFRKFIRSAYFSKGRKVLKLYDVLKKYYPEFNNITFTKENVFKKTYGNRKYDDLIMRKQISVLKQMADDFLTQIHIEKDTQLMERSLLTEYSLRGLDKFFRNSFEKTEKNLDLLCWNGEKYYYNKMLLQDIKVSSLYNPRLVPEQIRVSNHYLTDYFIFRKLKLLYMLYALDTGSFENLKATIMDDIKTGIDKNNYVLTPVMQIYYNVIRALSSDSAEDYFNAKKLINKYFQNLDRFHKMSFYLMLQNIIFRNLSKGKVEFQKELKEIFKVQFENRLFFDSENESLSYVTFRNTVLLGLNIGENDLIEEFIYTHYEKISGESKETMLNYALAQLSFKKNEFDKSVSFCSKVDFDEIGGSKENFTFILDIKRLLLMNYYELGYYDEAVSLLDTLRHFVGRTKKIPENIIRQNKNFIKYYNKLLQYRYIAKKGNISDIKRQILNCPLISRKEWFLSKIKDLSQI